MGARPAAAPPEAYQIYRGKAAANAREPEIACSKAKLLHRLKRWSPALFEDYSHSPLFDISPKRHLRKLKGGRVPSQMRWSGHSKMRTARTAPGYFRSTAGIRTLCCGNPLQFSLSTTELYGLSERNFTDTGPMSVSASEGNIEANGRRSCEVS